MKATENVAIPSSTEAKERWKTATRRSVERLREREIVSARLRASVGKNSSSADMRHSTERGSSLRSGRADMRKHQSTRRALQRKNSGRHGGALRDSRMRERSHSHGARHSGMRYSAAGGKAAQKSRRPRFQCLFTCWARVGASTITDALFHLLLLACATLRANLWALLYLMLFWRHSLVPKVLL